MAASGHTLACQPRTRLHFQALFRRLSDSHRQPFALPLQTLVPVKKNHELTLGREITETRKRDPWGGVVSHIFMGIFQIFQWEFGGQQPFGYQLGFAFQQAVPLLLPPPLLSLLSTPLSLSFSLGSDSSFSWLRA